MKLSRLTLTDYRNISFLCIVPDETVNVICGENAQGKTNLIEAIWLLTGNPSFRGAKASELLRFGSECAKIEAAFTDRQREQGLSLRLGAKREIRLNDVPLKSTNELSGTFYAVVFSPAHLSFVKDGPSNRRRFLDIAISQIKSQYKSYLMRYEKLMEQRNALLKNASMYRDLAENIAVWDEQIAAIGTILTIYRCDYIERVRRAASKIYEGLSGGRENLTVSYASTVFEKPFELKTYDKAWVSQYRQKLSEQFESDCRQGFTETGPHRDDLVLELDGNSARSFGSQGQQRSCVIALKLAEAQVLKAACGESPVMLLDDVMSELDRTRQQYILNNLDGMQVFVTCCEPSQLSGLRHGKVFDMKNGCAAEWKKKG